MVDSRFKKRTLLVMISFEFSSFLSFLGFVVMSFPSVAEPKASRKSLEVLFCVGLSWPSLAFQKGWEFLIEDHISPQGTGSRPPWVPKPRSPGIKNSPCNHLGLPGLSGLPWPSKKSPGAGLLREQIHAWGIGTLFVGGHSTRG